MSRVQQTVYRSMALPMVVLVALLTSPAHAENALHSLDYRIANPVEHWWVGHTGAPLLQLRSSKQRHEHLVTLAIPYTYNRYICGAAPNALDR